MLVIHKPEKGNEAKGAVLAPANICGHWPLRKSMQREGGKGEKEGEERRFNELL